MSLVSAASHPTFLSDDSGGWYKKATNLIASLHLLMPDKIKHEDTAFATREEFKDWLHANREVRERV